MVSTPQKTIEELRLKINELNEPERGILNSITNLIIELFEKLETPKLAETLKEESLIEFLKKKGLKTHTDRVVGMAYYLDKYKGVDPFNVKDIEEIYEEARIQPPKNLSDIVAKQAKRGLFIEAKEKKDGLKAWRISAAGIEYIESLLEE